MTEDTVTIYRRDGSIEMCDVNSDWVLREGDSAYLYGEEPEGNGGCFLPGCLIWLFSMLMVWGGGVLLLSGRLPVLAGILLGLGIIIGIASSDFIDLPAPKPSRSEVRGFVYKVLTEDAGLPPERAAAEAQRMAEYTNPLYVSD